MFRSVFCACVLTAALATTTMATAGSVSDLLEKGIYTEETVGNLDEAISIYQKVVAEAKANQTLAAQAQFRLGQCLLKQGKKAEATAAFEKLISSYPDEKDLVAKARQHVPEGLPLGPVPWEDGEVLELRMRMAGGMEIGNVVFTAQSAELNGQKIWRMGSRLLVIVNNVYGESHVDADWNTFQPINSVYKLTVMGTFIAEYTPKQTVVTIEAVDGSKSTKKYDMTEVAYDNEQAMDVIRRLPLTPEYKTHLPIFTAMGAGNIKLPLEVQGKEKVKVPAGEFECFKVHLGMVNQDFYFSTDAHRYLVKFEAGAVSAELASIDRIKPGESRQYGNKELGFSVTMPSLWLSCSLKDKVHLLDPQMIARSTISTVKIADLKAEEQKSIRAWADANVAEAGKMKKDFAVRADSWQERKIADMPAISVVADFVDGKNKMIDYHVFVLGDSVGWKFATSVPPGEFDAIRQQFDEIVDSLKVDVKMKQP